MIVIISEDKDQSTTDVIEWINFFGVPFMRVNGSNEISGLSINADGYMFRVNNKMLKPDEVTALWYRRGFLNFRRLAFGSKDFPFKKTLQKYEAKELSILNSYLFNKLKPVKCLGDFHNTEVNKLVNLDTAKLMGLNVPDTLITTNKQELEAFLSRHKQVITKSIGEVIIGFEEPYSITSYTSRIITTDDLPNDFFPALFQQEIPKKYEVRVFYLRGSFYSMAIFSQEDRQTSIDFRNYNHEKPNRVVPYQLPKDVSAKLDHMMKKCRYDTGSIDLIVTPDNQFYFLEINPVGQFAMVSYPCNYRIEKKIAEYLCAS